jgi:hypothetical protein
MSTVSALPDEELMAKLLNDSSNLEEECLEFELI